MSLKTLNQTISNCELCPRLRKHCLKTAQEKKKAYAQEHYWGNPISGFGDPNADLVIIGLAPAAHGANRTGRVFTGDRSGEWLYRELHAFHWASHSTSLNSKDCLILTGAYITCAVKCAPPQNRPTPREQHRCAPYLEQEILALKNARVYLALGSLAYEALWKILGQGETRPKFAHGVQIRLKNGKTLLLSFHPSQQNTFTGRLTRSMWTSVFLSAQGLVQQT